MTRIFPHLALLSVVGTALAENRVVFLAGSRSHGPGEHEFNAGCQLLAKALNEQSGLDVEAEVIQGWPSDPAVLDGAKAVVIYSDATSVVGKGWERMDALTKKGVGVMFMHYAVHPSAEDGDKYFRPWIGGAFETGWSVNPHWVADLKGLPNHPVSRGVAQLVEAYDEFYYNMRFRPNRGEVLDLVTATLTRGRIKRYINLWNENGAVGIDKPQALMRGVERPDGDGKFDPPKDKRGVLHTGFAGRQHDHILHSVTAGPDGLWYWNQGNTGAEFKDNSGTRFFMGSPYQNENVAGLRSDDGHVWVGGFAARMNPDCTEVKILGYNFRNSYEQAGTSYGDIFQGDNDDPPAYRVTALIEGAHAGFASAAGKLFDPNPLACTPQAEWIA